MIGHGQPGLRSGMRSFLEMTELTASTKEVFVELRPIQEVDPESWAVDSGSTYVAPFEFIFDGIRRDVTVVRSPLDAGLRRVQTIADCRAASGTFYYDADEEFGQTALTWDQAGLTWDAVPTVLWDQFPRLYAHLEDDSDPSLTSVVAALSFYFSSAGRTRLGDQQVHPALSEDYLLVGDFETWVDNVPSGWVLSGAGNLPTWDDGATNWDAAEKFWDPLTLAISKDETFFKEGAASLRINSVGSEDRRLQATLTDKLVAGKKYRVSGYYASQANATEFNEGYEATGYDETWSSSAVVGAGNTYDPDAATSGAGSPSGWGAQCLKVVQVNPEPAAYRIHTESFDRYKLQFEYVLASTGVTSGNEFNIAVVFAVGGTAAQILVKNDAGTLKFLLREFAAGEVSSGVDHLGPAITLNQRYVIEFLWDVPAKFWEWRVDNVTLYSGIITDPTPAKASAMRIGVNTTVVNNGTMYFDNVSINSGETRGHVGLSQADGTSSLLDDGRSTAATLTTNPLLGTGGEWRRFVFDFIATHDDLVVTLQSKGSGSVWFDALKIQRVWRYNWYEPKLYSSSLPAISTGSNDIFFGGKTIGVGNVKLMNQDGMLERLAAEVEWMNQEVLVDLGGQFTDDQQEILADDFFRGFTGLVQAVEADDKDFSLDLQDQRVFFHIKLPPRLYDDEVFSSMDVRRQGKPRPVFFGAKENIDPMRVSMDGSTAYGVYEICDTTDAPNGIKSVDAVYAYVDSEAAILKLTTERITLAATVDYSVDLVNGRINVLRDMGPYVIADDNRRLDFDIGGSALVATLTEALYTATDLALEIQTQMRAAAAVSTIDVAYSNTTHKFTISRPSGTLNLKTNTGTNKDRSPWKLIGFNLGSDKTGSTSYTGDAATFTSADKDHLLRVDAQGYKDDAVGTYTGSPLSLIEIGADICRVLLIKFMKKSSSIVDSVSFLFARQRASESLTLFLNESVSTKDVFDRLEFSNIANIVVNGEGKVFYKVYVGDVPSDIVNLDDRHFSKFASGASNREVFTTIRVKHDQDPSTGVFDAREATDTSVIARLGRPDIREFETYIRQGDNAISIANRLLELSRTAARKITGETLGSIMLRLEVGDKFRVSRKRAFAKGGVIKEEIFRVIQLSKNPLAGKVSFEATDDRVTVASQACVESCQQFCESTCQAGCEQICQGTCETTCQGSCEGSCQVSCETACQSVCQLGCQTVCQQTCQEACQLSCQAACQGAGCQTACQVSCQTACELTCQTACQSSCQGNCQVTCQTGCQVTCQTGCQVSCQTACEVGCQTTCELNCQTGCQTSCQSGCQVNCQTKSETSI